jgi:DNA-directed RNA polymerase I, II, and III subunit RPABC2
MSELLDNVANTITDIKDSILGDDSSDDEYVPPPPPPEEDDDDSSDDDNGNKPPPPSGTALDSDDDIIDDDDDDDIIDDDDDIIDDDDDDNDNSGNFNRNMMDLSQPSGFDNADIDSDDDDDDENYLQKFDETIQQQIITDYHPELKYHNHDEVNNLSTVVRNEYGVIIDPLHQSVPFITRYEKAKILGERAKQLSSGAKPFVEVEDNIIDEYLIALKEFNEKKIPFIIKRPMPNGGCEYWKFEDLEIIA